MEKVLFTFSDAIKKHPTNKFIHKVKIIF